MMMSCCDKTAKGGTVKKKAVFVVVNDRGLHTRPSTALVKCACGFKSDVKLTYHHQEVSAKSLLGILMLAAPKGAKISVEAEGEDAERAVDSILDLAQDSFGIRY